MTNENRPPTNLRSAGRRIVCALLILAAFAWGYLAHRNQIFPYGPARGLAQWFGLVKADKPADVRIGTPASGRNALLNIPYVTGTVDSDAALSGVISHDPQGAIPGLNLFSPRFHPRAFLVDMDGKVVHRWRGDSGPWQHVELISGGGLLALVKDEELLRLDESSNVLWRRKGAFHHDLSVDADGRIYALTRRLGLRPEVHPELPTLADSVTMLSADGELLSQIPLLDLLLESPYAFLLPDVRDLTTLEQMATLDILHTNHVEVFDGHLEELSPLYRAGNLLLSMRTLSTIFIVDPRQRKILWCWGPSNLAFQHHPTLLENGHILVFNNGTERSEVVEVDPLEQRVVWRYTAEDFFSQARGSVQRLANGNTLITESDSGYVFEVTAAGERVWVFANPFFTEGVRRMPIWRMKRFELGDPRLPVDLN